MGASLAMTTLLRTYLELERQMLLAEGIGERTADIIRDAMDPIWHALSDEDRAALDQREVEFIRSQEGLRVPLGDHIYYRDSGPPVKSQIPKGPIKDWHIAA